MAQASIDSLQTTKKLIDLEGHSEGDFGMMDEYTLSFIFDDILLVEYVDEESDGSGDAVMRGGIYVPTNTLSKAWRKAVVILAGPEVKYTKVGDIVMFPNDKGASVSNIEIEGHGKIKKGMFLNEQRLFGICKPKKSKKSKKTKEVSAVKKRLKAIAAEQSKKK